MICNGSHYSGKRQANLLGPLPWTSCHCFALPQRHTHIFYSSGRFILFKLKPNLITARLFPAHSTETGESLWWAGDTWEHLTKLQMVYKHQVCDQAKGGPRERAPISPSSVGFHLLIVTRPCRNSASLPEMGHFCWVPNMVLLHHTAQAPDAGASRASASAALDPRLTKVIHSIHYQLLKRRQFVDGSSWEQNAHCLCIRRWQIFLGSPSCSAWASGGVKWVYKHFSCCAKLDYLSSSVWALSGSWQGWPGFEHPSPLSVITCSSTKPLEKKK